MNSTYLITKEQDNKRRDKARQIYNDGLVEKINDKEYLIKNKYIVTELDYQDFFTCSCNDFKYRASMILEDTSQFMYCCHILAVIEYIMNNGA